MKPSLLILAAGIGSRYGGLKQLEPLGPNGETIMDYSIYDALQAGFEKIVVVIRKEFLDEFEKRLAPIRNQADITFTFQEVNPKIAGVGNITYREKPWGTVHAVLIASKIIEQPFSVINADDFYGKEAFINMAEFLENRCTENYWSMMGYQLKNTLSTNGGVSRGVCEIDESGLLKRIKECRGIQLHNGSIGYSERTNETFLNESSIVSMNFWGFHSHFFDVAENHFNQFVLANKGNPKSEMVIPDLIQPLIIEKSVSVAALTTNEKWFGVTHKEDKESVVQELKELIENNLYTKRLWL